MNLNRRQNRRVSTNLTIDLQIDQQITIQGRIRNISEKSAFIQMKSSVYMKVNDELDIAIKYLNGDSEQAIKGRARISRLEAGQGIAIYFIKMEEDSIERLQQLVNKPF
ncbi:MAG: PilZ domain-containing protein [Candidatus Omnitrophica bacterium]|nr:PilZ domain-containing protein [Candidatus Omnitrophota bacterium]MCB9748352.1 PilZ domain-containing protein [Candidatus Omnitrophota bacterium]